MVAEPITTYKVQMNDAPTLQKCTHIIAVLNEHILKGETIKSDEKGK